MLIIEMRIRTVHHLTQCRSMCLDGTQNPLEALGTFVFILPNSDEKSAFLLLIRHRHSVESMDTTCSCSQILWLKRCRESVDDRREGVKASEVVETLHYILCPGGRCHSFLQKLVDLVAWADFCSRVPICPFFTI